MEYSNEDHSIFFCRNLKHQIQWNSIRTLFAQKLADLHTILL